MSFTAFQIAYAVFVFPAVKIEILPAFLAPVYAARGFILIINDLLPKPAFGTFFETFPQGRAIPVMDHTAPTVVLAASTVEFEVWQPVWTSALFVLSHAAAIIFKIIVFILAFQFPIAASPAAMVSPTILALKQIL